MGRLYSIKGVYLQQISVNKVGAWAVSIKDSLPIVMMSSPYQKYLIFTPRNDWFM